MSSRKTSKLNLHAWEGKDAFRRDEFNENFEAIDKNAEATWAEVMKKADADTVSELQSTVTEKVEIVTGTYTGDNKLWRTIELGFTPKAVYVCSSDGLTREIIDNSPYIFGGLALPDHPVKYNSWNAVAIQDGGFQVSANPGGSQTIATNRPNVTYHYVAFK